MSLRDTFDAEAVFPARGFFDLVEAGVNGVADLRAANVFEPGAVEGFANRFEVPHPEVGTVANPRSKQAGNATRALFNTKQGRLHEGGGIGVVAGHEFEVREDETKDAADAEVLAGVVQGDLAILFGEVLKDVGAIDAFAGPGRDRKTLDNVTIAGVLRKHRPACNQFAEGEALDAQGGAGVEIQPSFARGKSAAVLDVKRIHFSNCHRQTQTRSSRSRRKPNHFLAITFLGRSKSLPEGVITV